MVRALAYCDTAFDPASPGRLCRGRERWVSGWDPDQPVRVHRLVISGAEFSDDSARDARRGLTCAGVDIGALLRGLFPEQTLVAFREEGVAPEVPAYAPEHERDWSFVPRQAGAWTDVIRRWRSQVEEPAELHRLVAEDLIDGLLVLPAGASPALSSAQEDALYLLTGHGDGSSWPVRRFQPMALQDVLAVSEAVVAVHLDKHGPALGVYTLAPLDCEPALEAVARQAGALAVPFTIPPMLARWDRALQELRMRWTRERRDEFPVPPAEEPTRWSRAPRSRHGEE